MDLIKAYREEFQKRLPALAGDENTRARRQEAIKAFEASGMPRRRMEDWRYSDLTSFGRTRFQSKPAPVNLETRLPAKVTGWPRLVFLNGRLIASESDPISDPGIEVLETAEALAGPGWAEALSSPAESNALENLNLAFSEGGFALRIKKGAKTDGIEILLLFEGGEKDACHLRNLVVVEPGADISLFLSTNMSKHFGWANLVNRLVVGKEASLDLYTDYGVEQGSVLTSSEAFSIDGGRGAMNALLLGSGSTRQNITARIDAEHSEVDLSGVMLAAGNHTLDVLTRVNHKAGHSNSRQSFRAVAARGGKTAFQGRVTVDKDAQKTDASQSSRNLLLDAGSETNIKPELIINADDVKCSHGATVGELDKDALFYLMQRGLDARAAGKLLIRAFVSEVIDSVPDEQMREAFGARVEARLDNLLSETGKK